MNRHLVAAVSVGCDAKISPAVLATGADETENTDCTIGGIIFLQSVTIIGKLGIQLRASFLPHYLQGMVALRLATQRGVRA